MPLWPDNFLHHLKGTLATTRGWGRPDARTDRGAAQQNTNHQFDPRFHPTRRHSMRVRLIRPGNMAQAIASHLPTLQKFASEVVPTLREARQP
jgi:hypothetical protein